jgi:centromeric protein E
MQTIESSPRDEGYADEDITLSQLNLIDLAGSESSKTETTGLRRKEGSFINKSLLTLGTVIAKLSDGKASHIPYRDSKLTRLLQSSLSGHGRISLICTITPASSNNEETHNTLKFAHRAKRIEIHASSNRILDEKSLIKKYQREICNLKLELEQLRRGILQQPYLANASHEDLLYLRQQLEAGQVKMQSRLEEEEQAKAALMGRIQRLTKLILVSTKNTIPPVIIPEKPNNRRRHSFGEEELAYLPDKRRDLILEEDEEECQGLADEGTTEGRGDYSGTDDNTQEEKKSNKKRGMLAWFKIRKSESLNSSPSASFDTEENPNAGAIVPYEPAGEFKGGPGRKSFSRRVEELSGIDAFPEPTQAGDLFSATVRGRRPPPTGTTMADQIDLLREQIKMLAGEVAFCSSSLKRLIEQAANNPDDLQIQVQIDKTKEEIQEKKRQMRLLEQRINSADIPQLIANPQEMSQVGGGFLLMLTLIRFSYSQNRQLLF